MDINSGVFAPASPPPFFESSRLSNVCPREFCKMPLNISRWKGRSTFSPPMSQHTLHLPGSSHFPEGPVPGPSSVPLIVRWARQSGTVALIGSRIVHPRASQTSKDAMATAGFPSFLPHAFPPHSQCLMRVNFKVLRKGSRLESVIY